ncbi:unnamed protein product [Pylaiella littoralis]
MMMCADLFGADPDDVDGYVATGSSESNACAIRWACETFSSAPFIGGENMHFSIKRAIKVVGRELLQVKAEKGGEMDIDALGRGLAGCRDQGVSEVCVMLVCGTTMGEAHDNIDAAIKSSMPRAMIANTVTSTLTVPTAGLSCRFSKTLIRAFVWTFGVRG